MVDTQARAHEAEGFVIEDGDGKAVLGFHETSYEMELVTLKPIGKAAGKRVRGVIRAQAKRIDTIGTGGKFVEPVYGRPGRIAGRVVAVDGGDQTVTVDAGVPMVMKTNGLQRAEEFAVGDFVTMYVAPGATFTPGA